jgi:hypothetical protein
MLLYGGSLLPNRASAIQGWKSFIETIPTTTGNSIARASN